MGGHLYLPGEMGKIINPPSGGAAPIINYIGSYDTPGGRYSPGAYSIGLKHSDYIYTAVSGDAIKEIAVYSQRISSPDATVTIGIYDFSSGNLNNQVWTDTISGIGSVAGWFTKAVNWSLSAGTVYAMAVEQAGTNNAYLWFTNVDAAKRSTWYNGLMQDPWSQTFDDRARFEFYAKVER